MENTDKGFRNFRTCGGMQNTFQQESSPAKNSRNTSHESRLKTPGTSGNRQHVGEVSHLPNQSFKRGIFEQCFPSWEEGQGKPPCNQLKTPESVHTIPTLKNGRLVLSDRNVAEGQFHVQTGHEGCIFSSTTSSVLKKICQILWSDFYKFLCLWLRPSTSNIHKTFKSPYISTEKINIQVIIYLNDMLLMGQTMEEILRYNHLPSATSGFHFKHGEINFESSSRDRISWSDSKLCENDTFIARTKNKTDSGSMSRSVCERFCHGLEADKTYRSFSFNNPSCITGTIKLSISSAATDKCF